MFIAIVLILLIELSHDKLMSKFLPTEPIYESSFVSRVYL